MSILRKVANTVKTGRIQVPYSVGSPSKGMPVDVRLSMDANFNKAVTKWVTIGAAGIGLGIAAGIVISKIRRR
jgi:hypothetical protein